jgi:magnesium chelatase family protein
MASMGAVLAPDALPSGRRSASCRWTARIVPVAGALPAAIAASALGRGLICPAANGPEAAWAGRDLPVIAPVSLIGLVNHFRGTQVLSRPEPRVRAAEGRLPDLGDVRGQESAKRALEIAAAGGHHLLFVGPPGSGKSMLASRLPSLLPPLEPQALLEVSMIHSIAGALADGKLSDRRPFRAPHHSASMAALIGGGLRARPGEVSLAHQGVLFLDELPEFHPQALDALRQPLESGEVVIARANHRVAYPARFQLVAAMNPCRCGMAGEPGHSCRRGPRCAADYQSRVSGPMHRPHRPAASTCRRSPASDLALPRRPRGRREAGRPRRRGPPRCRPTRFDGLGEGANAQRPPAARAFVEEIAVPRRRRPGAAGGGGRGDAA